MPVILQVLPALEQGGVERGAVEIDNALVAAGWKSIVMSNGGQLTKKLHGTHLKLPLNTKNPLKMLINAHALRLVIKQNNVDIIHARSRAPGWSAYLAAKGTSAHFITTFHGTHGLKNALKRYYNSVMAKGEVVIAVSEFIRNHVIENYGAAPEKVVTIHRGADLKQFGPDIKPVGLGLTAGKKVVMLPGRITRWKGQHIFVEAMRTIDAIGVIVGNATNAQYMRELDKILPDNVIILPGTPDLSPVLANADIVVSASTKPEAFGRIAIEAQAMGKPVVTTNIGGALETVVNGKTGLYVAPGDVKAMREAILKLLDMDCKDACLANAAKFSTSVMCAKTLEIYSKVIDRLV